MKFAVHGLTFLAILGLAACQQTPQQAARAPTDTGSMAYPAAVPAGNISTTRPTTGGASTDTGSMAYPRGSGLSNQSGANPRTNDTGSMAYPGR